ncbi:MAG: prepilin-type N-terminal cleavage/methylation domain-containing protein, partial [Burkholderiales bacterium]|nr:prepilin-type N-terminal cleavage/methylation domain-containing protein [Burkholderiales bacterium]
MDGHHSHATARGFTLIEIAIVTAIVLTLVTLGLGLVNAHLSSAAYSVTKKRQEAIKDALIAYLGTHKKFPCPIDVTTW